MSTNRKIAVWVGVLYIIGTVAGVLSVVTAGSPLLGADDYLTKIADNESQMYFGVLCVLIMGVLQIEMMDELGKGLRAGNKQMIQRKRAKIA
jgi:hypothetical protein